jgi:beta-mannosidase
METFRIDSQWFVLQDVADRAEQNFMFLPNWSRAMAPFEAFSEWQPIDRLTHLQLLFAKNPYFGRELRYFNTAPWWYKNEFTLARQQRDTCASLRFEGVDYYCKVWLNGAYLGEHEGYFAPFEFEVAHLLKYDEPNTLVVKVWSPFDREGLSCQCDGLEFRMNVHEMMKGTYDHADGFFQRDVNPVGIWRDVTLTFHNGVRVSENPTITTLIANGLHSADVRIAVPVSAMNKTDVLVRCTLIDETTGLAVAVAETGAAVQSGTTELVCNTDIQNPKFWNTWDRGAHSLYSAQIEVLADGISVQKLARRFGVRSVELRRTKEETTFLLNGKALFLRGTSYFPEVYISKMDRAHYLRDLSAIKHAGCNAVRIHVHVAKPELYDICDELGLAVIQDSDLNWIHPDTEAFKDRAVKIFGDMVKMLRNHASIICWICMNEPDIWNLAIEAGMVKEINPMPTSMMNETPGPQLVEAIKQLDPTRPYIKGSRYENDLESGDSHNYTGSLYGADSHYTDIYETREKLNTEFGIDAPPAAAQLMAVPEIYQRLKKLVDSAGEIDSIQYYQYRLTKYFIEHYRITKYRPCSGYFQFLFTDICPQSFYGVYDFWGMPKLSLRAFEESNQPVGVFMELKDKPVALWVVNDTLESYSGCTVEWTVSDQNGRKLLAGSQAVDVSEDCAVRICDFTLDLEQDIVYRVNLVVYDRQGTLLTRNVYDNAFNHPVHPKGHPGNISHEFGMRTFTA